ncbi:MAG: DegV family protein [Lachnospiraceae bacterium]|nr:DegV family protein [Lachnospiraceae bacterium]
MRDFVITTDSNSDLPESYIKEKQIGVIPHYYDIDAATYGGGNELPVKEFYDKMRAGSSATTTASNPAVIRETFTRYISQGYDILHISFSSALSGGYNNICVGAAEICEAHPEARIVVLDTLNVSLGQGLAIMKAVQMKEAGCSLDEIHSWLEEHKQEFCVQFTVEDLKYLYRGGRISKTTAVVGSLINVKPVLYVNPDGQLVSLSTVRGRKRSLATLVANMEERRGSYKEDSLPICIVHGDALQDAEYTASLIREKFGTDNILINTVGPSIGAHSGPGAIGICFMGDHR